MPINAAKQLFEAEIITKGLFNVIYLVKVRTRAHSQIPTDADITYSRTSIKQSGLIILK